jgi:hypothetical protein
MTTTLELSDTQAAWLENTLESLIDRCGDEALATGNTIHLFHRRNAKDIVTLLRGEGAEHRRQYEEKRRAITSKANWEAVYCV